MTVIYTNWTPGLWEPATHPRMLHEDNLRADGTLHRSGVADGYFEDGPNNGDTFEAFQPATDTGFWGREWPFTVLINCVGIAGHDLGTTGSQIRIDITTVAEPDWTISQASQTVSDDSPIMWFFDPLIVTGIRVHITSGTSRPTIGVIRFGAVTQFEQPIFAGVTPSRYARTTSHDPVYSQTGKLLGRHVERSNLSGTIPIKHMTPAWLDSDWHEAMLALEKGPFFLAWRPDSSKTTGLYDDVIYGVATETPKVTTMGVLDYLESSINYTAEAYE
ncbi:hypothetical protein [Dinoroseobacter sp. S124A]|uniref:hypothetical protein n=1 Tax=Dinoroseobacter sp. S124A TaxID=3415128 RepID=UPI003C7982F9